MSGRRILRALVGLAFLPLFSGVAVNAATNTSFPGPLRWIQLYPWQSVVVALLGGAVYVVWDIRSQPAGKAKQARLHVRLLGETRRTWVDGVLSRSLADALRIELDVVSQQSKIAGPALVLVRAHDADSDELAAGTPPVELFHRFGEQLLILGEPGAGKTTMLLELAEDLVVTAETDPAATVPVVLSLASWAATPKASFVDWVLQELNRFYRLPRAKAKYVLEHGMATLLLDGLDEVHAGQFAECVNAINMFWDDRTDTSIAITCCTVEYDRLTEKQRLKLAGSVLIQPLTSAQLDNLLASIGEATAELRDTVRGDADLQDLLRTPLALSVAALAFRDHQIETFTGLDSLFGSYNSDYAAAPPRQTRRYDDADVGRWLTTLARGMTVTYSSVLSPALQDFLRMPWIDSDAVPWSPVRWLLLIIGAVPVALLAGMAGMLIGSWQASVGIAALTAAIAWVPRAEKRDFRRGPVAKATLGMMLVLTFLPVTALLRAIARLSASSLSLTCAASQDP